MLFSFVTPHFAQDELKYDTQEYQDVDFFDSNFKEKYADDSDFDYRELIQQKSLWQRFKDWLGLQWNEFLRWLLSGVDSSSFWSILGFILKWGSILGLIFLIIYLFAKYNPGQSFLKKSSSPQIQWSEEERIINQKDIPKLVEEAIVQENYRMATRYYFLLLLKELRDRELIDYAYQKTNETYQIELNKTVLSSDFSEATRYYEYIWYGDFAVDQILFKSVKERFESLLSQINKTQKDA